MKLLSSLFPQNEFLGIHFGYKNVCLTVGGYNGLTFRTDWQEVFTFDECFSYTDENFSHILKTVFTSIPDKFKQQYLPAQIALPDSLFSFQKLTFSEFPANNTERYALINWQLSKSLNCTVEKLSTTWQMLDSIDKGQNVLAYGLDKEILNSIRYSLEKSGFQAGTINASSFFRYDLIDSHALEKAGVLLALEKDYWSLMFWSAGEYFNYVYSDKRKDSRYSIGENDTDDQGISEIVSEAERIIWSYIQQHENIQNIYITATNEEISLLENKINQRLEFNSKLCSIQQGLNSGLAKINKLGMVDFATIIKQ